MLSVVLARQIAENGAALENGKLLVVMIYDDRDAAVGVERSEPWLLLDVLHDVDALNDEWEAVSLLQFLQDNASLVAIWSA